MSTEYRPLQDVPFSALFDGALARFGVREHVCANTQPFSRCLTDGNNCLWVDRGEDGFVAGFTRWGYGNVPTKILRAICETFDVQVVSEYEPQFWGFATQEEWDEEWERHRTEGQDELYGQVMHYIRGEGHNLVPGTIGMTKAEIAKTLIDETPNFALPENKDELLKAMESKFLRDHSVVMPVTANVIAIAKMIATHEDDLPKA